MRSILILCGTGICLEHLYWRHVELFCVHDGSGLDMELNGLIDVMVQGRADHLTSKTSTFPFDAQECAAFLQTLESVRGMYSMGPDE